MVKREPYSKQQMCCGVISATIDKDSDRIDEQVKLIYKVDYTANVCKWATLQELYDYNIQPLVMTLEEWMNVFNGLCMNMYTPILTSLISIKGRKDPKPLDETGCIPEEEDNE